LSRIAAPTDGAIGVNGNSEDVVHDNGSVIEDDGKGLAQDADVADNTGE
jgi:hypothetical protein